MPSNKIVMRPGRCSCQIAVVNLSPCLLPSMKKLKDEIFLKWQMQENVLSNQQFNLVYKKRKL